MNDTLKAQIKRVLSSHTDSLIFYHEQNEWSIYRAGEGAGIQAGDNSADLVLLEGNDYRNVRGFAPELVVALAEMLGIRVVSKPPVR